jgi:hypothetical protein
MRYLKQYEQYGEIDIDINDYVLCTDHYEYEDEDINYLDFVKFLSTHVGQYIGQNNTQTIYTYAVIYKDVPQEISEYFSPDRRLSYPKNYRLLKTTREDILYHSKNKEDVLLYIKANKYNI